MYTIFWDILRTFLDNMQIYFKSLTLFIDNRELLTICCHIKTSEEII